mmetsp:Transcript_12529/g.30762  ORF Transcript_12529/g.30762 Transcript_12529/m.30762 type:complete len:572 (-) Transcript_12529:151-1866(-)
MRLLVATSAAQAQLFGGTNPLQGFGASALGGLGDSAAKAATPPIPGANGPFAVVPPYPANPAGEEGGRTGGMGLGGPVGLGGLGSFAAPSAPDSAMNSGIGSNSTSEVDFDTLLHKAFHYQEIARYIIGTVDDIPPDACRRKCAANSQCIAWEVCRPLGDGCDGCYNIATAPPSGTYTRELWHAEIFADRAGDAPVLPAGESLVPDDFDCHDFLLRANGGDHNSNFHDHNNLGTYNHCLWRMWSKEIDQPKKLLVSGQHYPAGVVSNFRDPPVRIPPDVEREMYVSSGRGEPALQQPVGVGNVEFALHDATGTTPWSLLEKQGRPIPHTWVLPMYDTNIGHWIKEFGAMNVMQSYEMQSLLRPGDVVVDAGANLGCYTVPFAEKVGSTGKVLAFEPFRLTYQHMVANMAVNGISNVWTFRAGLGATDSFMEARSPQFKFFSSPGGVRVAGQSDGLREQEVMQLYDHDSPAERIRVHALDGVVLGEGALVPVGDVRLIKIDVEGMEVDVIQGAVEVMRRFKPIVWSENVPYFESGDTQFVGLMQSLGYGCAKAQNAPNDLVCVDSSGQGHQI